MRRLPPPSAFLPRKRSPTALRPDKGAPFIPFDPLKSTPRSKAKFDLIELPWPPPIPAGYHSCAPNSHAGRGRTELMNPIIFALRHPYTVMVGVLALFLGGASLCPG